MMLNKAFRRGTIAGLFAVAQACGSNAESNNGAHGAGGAAAGNVGVNAGQPGGAGKSNAGMGGRSATGGSAGKAQAGKGASGGSTAGEHSTGGSGRGGGADSAGEAGAVNTAGSPAVETGVRVSPGSAHTSHSGRVQFSAQVTGVTPTSVTWKVTEGDAGGSITSGGLYTAPDASGIFHVVATSTADAALSDSASVTVSDSSTTPPALQAGVWTDISPPSGLHCCPESGGNSYGYLFIEIDPGNPDTLYTGADVLGIWKTTDRGSSWHMLGSPDNAMTGGTSTTYLDTPIRLRVDPNDSNHLYATQGVHGPNLGFWVSTDGGATWTMPKGFDDLAQSTTTRDVTMMDVDRADFRHVVVASHSPWKNLTNAGILESKDGGDTWIAHPPPADGGWNAGTIGISILHEPTLGIGDANTWLVGTDGGGFWRTTDAGLTWKKVADDNIPHGGHDIYYSANGVLYAGSTPWPLKSTDNGATWQQLNSLPFAYYYTVFGTGHTLYTSPAYTGSNGGSPLPFYSSPESDGLTWAQYQSGAQQYSDGPYVMRYDAANGILYSANWGAGVLALKETGP
jgi:hypothetical protein